MPITTELTETHRRMALLRGEADKLSEELAIQILLDLLLSEQVPQSDLEDHHAVGVQKQDIVQYAAIKKILELNAINGTAGLFEQVHSRLLTYCKILLSDGQHITPQVYKYYGPVIVYLQEKLQSQKAVRPLEKLDNLVAQARSAQLGQPPKQ